MENPNKVSRLEFVAFDKYIKTNLPELMRNQLRSNFEVFEDWFMDASQTACSACFLDRTRFTIGTFPGSTPLSCAQHQSPEDEFHPLADSQIFSASSSRSGTSRTFSPPARARRQSPSSSHHDHRTASNVNTLLFVEPKKGRPGKRHNRHLFGNYTPQLGDDDLHLSTRFFNATPHVLGQEPLHAKTLSRV